MRAITTIEIIAIFRLSSLTLDNPHTINAIIATIPMTIPPPIKTLSHSSAIGMNNVRAMTEIARITSVITPIAIVAIFRLSSSQRDRTHTIPAITKMIPITISAPNPTSLARSPIGMKRNRDTRLTTAINALIARIALDAALRSFSSTIDSKYVIPIIAAMMMPTARNPSITPPKFSPIGTSKNAAITPTTPRINASARIASRAAFKLSGLMLDRPHTMRDIIVMIPITIMPPIMMFSAFSLIIGNKNRAMSDTAKTTLVITAIAIEACCKFF